MSRKMWPYLRGSLHAGGGGGAYRRRNTVCKEELQIYLFQLEKLI